VSHPSDGFTGIVDPEVKRFVEALSPEQDPLVATMEAWAAEHRFPLVGHASGRVCEWLTRSIGGRRVFEFGSGYGYSAYFFARAVGEGGSVIGSEFDEHELVEHRRMFAGHPLAARIDLRHGDAFAIFAATEGLFDVVFIDIHKEGYVAALEAAVPRLRKGGLVIADNALWGGKVARPAEDANTAALQDFDRRAFADPRLECVLLPVGDGLLVARVR
jgi:caffeoyl-CoA O-methyltransferase